MALLKGGKIYDIDFKGIDASSDITVEDRVKDFMILYKDITGITDPAYNSICYVGEPEDMGQCSYRVGFRLPYISRPPAEMSNEYYYYITFGYSDGVYYDIILGDDTPNREHSPYIDPPDPPYDFSKCYYTMTMNNINYNHTNNPTEPEYESNFFFRIDARFLDTHGFYTFYYTFYTGTLQQIYFSPTYFICDMTDQITGEHYDQLVCIPNFPNYTIRQDHYSPYEKWPDYFRPQLYSNQDNSIVLQKLQFGRWKSDTIYLTNASKFNNLEALVNYQKMNEYKDCWLKDKLYSNGKHYIMGVASPQKFDYSIYDGTTAPYIPIISGREIPEGEKLPTWPGGTDMEIYPMINDFYDGNISLNRLQNAWFVGDTRVLSNQMMIDTNIEGYNNQKVEMTIEGFVENDNENEVEFRF